MKLPTKLPYFYYCFHQLARTNKLCYVYIKLFNFKLGLRLSKDLNPSHRNYISW